MKNNEHCILEGYISVESALITRSREIQVIYIQKDKDRGTIDHLFKLARSNKVKIKLVEKDFINKLATGKTHGGILAIAGERKYLQLEKLNIGNKGREPFVVMLDGIEDPFNFGYAIRTFHAAGVDGLVLKPRNWMNASHIVAKASAGASELIPTAVVQTDEEAAQYFMKKGLKIACASKENSLSIFDIDFTVPLFVVVGGEKRGVARTFKKNAELKFMIPYGRNVNYSLPTVSAASIIAFEVLKQRL
ncbi:MAG: RNA methyltransferase [Kosmotoga sp.]|nr:MAG: RNA methyltransferase [Kosmotoga sp.]